MARERILHITIKDCEVQTFRVGGKGGQRKDKRDTGVRIIHHPSGGRGVCSEHRTQGQNKKFAFSRMASSPEFQAWVRMAHAQAVGQIARVEAEVDKLMRDEDIEIEYYTP